MTKKPRQGKFAYDFEQAVCEFDEKIDELLERPAEEGEDVNAALADLQTQRDERLREMVQGLTPYQRVKLASHPQRPQARDYIALAFTDFVELHGDRSYADDRAVVTGLATIEGQRLMVVALHKGKDAAEKMACNWGMPHPEGYRKALRKMELAEKFGLPVVCLVDTQGAAADLEAEERGQGMAIAENIWRMTGLRTPIVVVVTGEGCSGGALGVGVGDRFAMMENAYYSVISPVGCAAILWRNGEMAEKAAEALKLTAGDMLEFGVIDTIIEEPLGGAHRDPEAAAQALHDYLARTIDELSAVPADELLKQRYERYRRQGAFSEV